MTRRTGVSSTRKVVHTLVDELPESELAAATRYLEYLHDFGALTEVNPEIDAAWGAEIKRRIDRIEAYGSRGTPWREAMKRIKQNLGLNETPRRR